ncbi:MAG: AMP-binding protein, partial [Myxococcaceae bacterium]|nr:AMP-binding protein [Myxococcaceae bacterium]
MSQWNAPNLIAAIDESKGMTDKGYTFLDRDQKELFLSWDELRAEAMKRAAHLRKYGLKKGDRVAMVLPDGEDFVPTFLGAIWAGLVPVPLYPPLSLGKLDSYKDTLVAILNKAEPTYLITLSKMQQVLWAGLTHVKSLKGVITAEELKGPAPEGVSQDPAQVSDDDLAFLQFTSGSTSMPKGVMVTHGNLVANAESIAEAMELDHHGDVGVSWLPLYHDMGLIGFVITPLMRAVEIVFVPTLSFVKRPNVWMQTMHDYKATLSFGPNFAFALAGRRAGEKELATWDLSRVRLLGCGAEPINASVIEDFETALAPTGLRRGAVMAAYGMAEATLAMSFGERLKPLDVVAADAETFRATGTVVAPLADGVALNFVSCGKCFPDHEVGIVDNEGNFLEDGQEGEIVVKGPSVTKGYWQNPEATEAVYRDGWLRTGDLGFVRGGDVFITGRCKDLIILNG